MQKWLTTICMAIAAAACAQTAQAASFAVEPAVVEVYVDAETSHTGNIVLSNPTDQEMVLMVSQADFVMDVHGDVQLHEQKSRSTALKLIDRDITIPAQTKKSVAYTVIAPAISQTTTAAIIVQTQCESAVTDNTNLCVKTRVVIPVLITVENGDDAGAIEAVEQSDEIIYSAVIENGQWTSGEIGMHNAQKYFMRPKFSVQIKNIWGKEVYREEIAPQHVILPGHTRQFATGSPDSTFGGRYSVMVTAENEGEVMSSLTTRVTHITTRGKWVSGVSAVLVIMLIAAGVQRARKIKPVV